MLISEYPVVAPGEDSAIRDKFLVQSMRLTGVPEDLPRLVCSLIPLFVLCDVISTLINGIIVVIVCSGKKQRRVTSQNRVVSPTLNIESNANYPFLLIVSYLLILLKFLLFIPSSHLALHIPLLSFFQ
jgi:hypothetical protein